jgi:biotin operon repressor
MATDQAGTMLTAAKLAESLGVSQGKVKKLLDELKIQPDDVQRGCKYYGPATQKKLKAALK